ncbi:conjugative coupling protein [Neorhizobium sp. NCHU2750]|nr:conjugative coupling protein [Neorhizobium sp. NCHU2750]
MMKDRLKLLSIIIAASAGLVVWLLAYGVLLRILSGDATMLDLMIKTEPFAPVKQFWDHIENARVQRIALISLFPALLASSILIIAIRRKEFHPLGNASFQDMASLRKARWFRKDGHILGRIGHRTLRVMDERHHIVIGPTRSGKGLSYVIPNALAHKGSMIVTDLKGEIFLNTADFRRRNGNAVFVFAPGSQNSNCYNPLDFIRGEPGDRTTDIQNIADMLIPETSGSENAIWQSTAQQVLAGIISYITESPRYEGRRSFGEINSFINSGEALQSTFEDIKAAEPYLSKFTIESFNSYIGLSERAAQSALLDLQKAMRPFKNEKIVMATSTTDIELSAIQSRPVTIYIAPNISDLNLLRPLTALFVQQILSLLTRELNTARMPVYFLLDEFCQLKRMDEIVGKLPFVAGYNIKLAFVVQDLKSLDAVYGENLRQSLLANCGYQLILGANDLATADYVSRALGKTTIKFKTLSRSGDLFGQSRLSKTEQVRERDLMMSQEIREMPGGQMLILCEGQKPILAQKPKCLARRAR